MCGWGEGHRQVAYNWAVLTLLPWDTKCLFPSGGFVKCNIELCTRLVGEGPPLPHLRELETTRS